MSSTKYFCIVLLLQICYCDWKLLSKGSALLPPNVYRMDLKQNTEVVIGLEWEGNSQLAVYLFQEGKNLLDLTQSSENLTSYDSSREFGVFSIEKTGTYYFKIEPELLDIGGGDSLPYTLMLNNTDTIEGYAGEIHKDYLDSAIKNISGFKSLSNTPLKFTFNSGNAIGNVFLISSNFLAINVSSNTLFCMNDPIQQDTWSLVIQHNLTSTTDLREISYNFYKYQSQNCSYKCTNNVVGNLTCIPPDPPITPPSTPNFEIIIPVIVASVALIVAIILVVILYKRFKRKNQQSVVKIEKSQQNLDSDKPVSQLNCSICLNSNCNLSLQCHHHFHKICLEQWQMTNKYCPVCQSQIIKTEIITNERTQ